MFEMSEIDWFKEYRQNRWKESEFRKNLNDELSVEEQQILDHENDLKAAEISTKINSLMNQLDSEKASLMELESKSKTAGHYRIRQDMMYDIKNIITNNTKRYSTWEDFVNESLQNAITFWSTPSKMQEIAADMWKDFTPVMKEEIKKTAPEFHYDMEMRFGEKVGRVANIKNKIDDVRTALSKCEFKNVSENKKAGDYIHQNYNRFFPLKILVTSLASMIKNDKQWVNYKEYSDEAFELALEFSDKLKEIKTIDGKDTHRNKRISTGLPHRYANDSDFEERTKNEKASKERFFKCFVGPKVKSFLRNNKDAKCNHGKCKQTFGKHNSSHDFSGNLILTSALNEMGLVHMRYKNQKLEITLSKNGFKFYDYKNPIIDGISLMCECDHYGDSHPKGKCGKQLRNGKNCPCKKFVWNNGGEVNFAKNDKCVIEAAFSSKERKFIEEKIIPKFELEKEIVDRVKVVIKKKTEGNDLVGKIIQILRQGETLKGKTEDEIKERGKLHQMATMGRLAEIGVADWEIENGKSFYSLNTKT